MTTTGEAGGDEIPLFVSGTDIRILVQSTRDTDFTFLSFRSTNHTTHLLGDYLIAKVLI